MEGLSEEEVAKSKEKHSECEEKEEDFEIAKKGEGALAT